MPQGADRYLESRRMPRPQMSTMTCRLTAQLDRADMKRWTPHILAVAYLLYSLCMVGCSSPQDPQTRRNADKNDDSKTQWKQSRAQSRKRWEAEHRRPMKLDASAAAYTKKASDELKVAVGLYYKENQSWPRQLNDLSGALDDLSIYQQCRFTIKSQYSFLAEYQLKGIKGEMGFGFTIDPKP